MRYTYSYDNGVKTKLNTAEPWYYWHSQRNTWMNGHNAYSPAHHIDLVIFISVEAGIVKLAASHIYPITHIATQTHTHTES